MESYAQSTNMKRFVIQDSFTKVTTDGEPHEMMTMIAGLSGLLAAIVILTILVSLVGCKKSKQQKQSTDGSSSMYSSTPSQVVTDGSDSKRSSVLSILRRDSSSIDENVLNENYTVSRPRLMSISCVSDGNFEGNLNAAFLGSELNLSGGDNLKKKQNNRMLQDNELRRDSVVITAKDTIVQVERY